MTLFFRNQRRVADLDAFIAAYGSTGARLTSATAPVVNRETSLQSSVKWACQRLRADLISTTPLDVFRQVGDLHVQVIKPPVLSMPDGRMDVSEWLYSSQFDLDDVGNTFALVKQRDRLGYPTVLEPLPASSVLVRVRSGQVVYEVDREEVPSENVWHERQFSTSGSPVGLSPTAYAVLALGGYLSAQQFAADWFSGHGVPAAQLQNTAKTLNADEATAVKAKFKDTVATGDVFVTGADWEYSMIGAKASESAFDAMMKLSAPDICRFYGVPGDVVDVESSTGNITYQNVTQRNLQLLILNLGPAFTRRERAFSNGLVPRGQVVKFNTDAILRMDPAGRGAAMDAAITSRRLTVTEARALENRPPLTPDDEAEFARLFPARAPQQGAPSE